MKTSDLITLLSANVQPANTRSVPWSVGLALLVGALLALTLVLLAFGIRPDIAEPNATFFVLVKLSFTTSVVAIAAVHLMKLARPGGEFRVWLTLTALPFAGVISVASASLASAPSPQWPEMMFNGQWADCLVSIPVTAIGPFFIIVLAVRWCAAPTDLKRTGALIGLVSGGISASSYAVHCTSDSVPFVALWYGGTIALCVLVGTKLGPRLLRW